MAPAHPPEVPRNNTHQEENRRRDIRSIRPARESSKDPRPANKVPKARPRSISLLKRNRGTPDELLHVNRSAGNHRTGDTSSGKSTRGCTNLVPGPSAHRSRLSIRSSDADLGGNPSIRDPSTGTLRLQAWCVAVPWLKHPWLNSSWHATRPNFKRLNVVTRRALSPPSPAGIIDWVSECFQGRNTEGYVDVDTRRPFTWFTASSSVNPLFHFHSVGGRYVVLCFFGSSADPASRRVLDDAMAGQSHFDVENACFCGVRTDPDDQRLDRVGWHHPGMIIFWDFDLAISRLYGASRPEGQVGL